MTHRPDRRRLVAAACLLPFAAQAQPGRPAWKPAKPVRIVVGFVPGGATDLVARVVAPELSQSWGQGVVVDNRAGASGIIAAEEVAHAPADGLTLMVAPQTSMTMAQPLYPKRVKYDTRRDFTPLTNLGASPQILVVPAASDIRSVADLVAFARREPGKATYGSGGNGTSLHLAGAILGQSQKVTVTHIPYKGEGAAVNDLIGGQLTFMFSNIFVALPFVKAGRLRALAVSGDQRASSLPDVPTFTEQTQVKLDTPTWYGLFAPAGLPADIAAQIVADCDTALARPQSRERFAQLGITWQKNSARQFDAFLQDEIRFAQDIVRSTGITAD
jgi:tripartite-type tricarboxylate transporter receptor subunit TctC